MIKVEINGTVFQCDTPEEAAAIARLVKNKPAASYNHSVNASSSVTLQDEEVLSFFNKIRHLEDGEYTSEELANVLDISVQGVGPKYSSIAKRLESDCGKKMGHVLARIIRPGSNKPLWRLTRKNLVELVP